MCRPSYKVKEATAAPNNILDYLQDHKIDLVINVPVPNKRTTYTDVLTDGYIIRRQAVEFNVPVIVNLELASALVKSSQATQRHHDSLPERVHGCASMETLVAKKNAT